LHHSEREWDVKVCPYEDLGNQDGCPTIPGQKWTGLSQLLAAWDDWQAYRYVWLPDDDIFAIPQQIDSFFRRCRELAAKIAAPALSEESFYTWPITMRNRSYVARETTYIENMAPCFRVDILREVLPTFSLTKSGFGWGLSYLWVKHVGYQGVFIVDDTPMLHTRPVGQTRDKRGVSVAISEMRHLLAEHGATPIQKTLRGYDAFNRVLDSYSDQFIVDYIAGYQYLVAKRPAVLAHLMAQQAVPLPGRTSLG